MPVAGTSLSPDCVAKITCLWGCVCGGLIPSLNVQSIKKRVLVLPARAVSCQVLGRTQGKGGRRLRRPKSSHARWKARHIAATHTLEKQRLDNRSHAMMHFCSLVSSLPVSNVGKLSPRSSSAEFERPAPWPAESVSAFPPQNAEGIFHPTIGWTVPWVATGNRLFFRFLCRRSHWITASSDALERSSTQMGKLRQWAKSATHPRPPGSPFIQGLEKPALS